MERPFTITVSSNGAVSPTTIPKAGVSGEHKATTLNYSLAVPQSGIYKYNIEIQSGLGESYLSEFITPSDGATRVVSFSIPSAITRMGAADFCLIETKVDALGEIISITKSAMTRCIFTASPDSLDELEADYTGLLQGLISNVENVYDAIEEMIANAGLYFNRPNFIFDTLADALAYDGDGFIIGSSVRTRGYYEANDNGGADYEIIASDNPDNIFSYAIDNDKMLSLIVANNEVYVDQLGAKGDVELGTHSLTGEEYTTLQDQYDYHIAIAQAGYTDNREIIQAAIDNANVHTIKLSSKVYGVRADTDITGNILLLKSNITFIGGTIKDITDYTNESYKYDDYYYRPVFRAENKTNITFDNVTIMGSFCRYKTEENVSTNAFGIILFFYNCNNIIINGCKIFDAASFGIKINGLLTKAALPENDIFEPAYNITIRNTTITRTMTAIYTGNVNVVDISDCFIDMFMNTLGIGSLPNGSMVPNANHGIYDGSYSSNYTINNLVINNCGLGCGIKRYAEYSLENREYLFSRNHNYSNISMTNVGTALYVGGLIDSTFTNIVANDSLCGISFPAYTTGQEHSRVENISINNLVFRTRATEYILGKAFASFGAATCINVVFNNCIAECYDQITFFSATREPLKTEAIYFNNCLFLVRGHSVLNDTSCVSPIYTKRSLPKLVFNSCRFVVSGGTDANLARDGAIISIGVVAIGDYVTKVLFYDCSFVNENNVTINSVYASHRSYEYKGYNYASFVNCRIHGFRLAIAVRNITDSTTTDNNPAKDGMPTEAAYTTYLENMNATKRYASINNLYSGLSSDYVFTKETDFGFGAMPYTPA